jgi:hypothetical protein
MTDVLLEETPSEATIEAAYMSIGLTPDITSPTIVLTSFKDTWEMQDKSDEVAVREIIDAKNTIMRRIVSEQMEKQRYFDIESPFENSCISCKGSGEIYKFTKKPVEVNCHICAGKKKIKVKCRVCKGSGRYIKRFPEGGGMNLECKVCHGTGKVRVKCSNCIGKGKLKKVVLDHVIKSTTPCKHCEELGFVIPKPKKKYHKKNVTPQIGTPVLDHETAVKLSNMIQES